jgi:hypothetical protein
MESATEKQSKPLTLSNLFRFFLPLGSSVFLVMLSHLIIQSTLARADNPAFVIATYAIATSLLPIFEKPVVVLRQVTSVLVRDRVSYQAMRGVFAYVFFITLTVVAIVAFTPIGKSVFFYLLGVSDEKIGAVTGNFKLLVIVFIFSSIRLFYHGIIISNLQTKWLTIAVGTRIIGMACLAYFFIHTEHVISGKTGVYIFLTGMFIEFFISSWQGNKLAKKLPDKLENHSITRKTDIFRFYRPLLYSSFLMIWIGPSINLVLNKTSHIEVAIASFVIAENLLQIINSFFYYTHQVVLQFYRANERVVVRFLLLVGFIPALVIGIFGYTAIGPWFFSEIIGVDHTLMTACIDTLRVFMICALCFPLVDACNGLMILNKQTKFFVWSQGTNTVVTIVTLVTGIIWTHDWTGVLAAWAVSFGLISELIVVLYILRKDKWNA